RSHARRGCAGRSRGPELHFAARIVVRTKRTTKVPGPMPLEIARVRGFADLRQFVALPYRLHAGTPWSPPLRLERYAFLTRKLNPYFKHGEAEYFLARRAGRVLGRVTAQIDHAYNAYHGTRWGAFGFLEFEDDQEVLDALLGAAETWLRGR